MSDVSLYQPEDVFHVIAFAEFFDLTEFQLRLTTNLLKSVLIEASTVRKGEPMPVQAQVLTTNPFDGDAFYEAVNGKRYDNVLFFNGPALDACRNNGYPVPEAATHIRRAELPKNAGTLLQFRYFAEPAR